MNEIKRVLLNRALILSFLLLTAVNLSVYVKEQKSTMPAGFKLYRQEQARLMAQLDPSDLDTALRYAEEWQQEQQSWSAALFIREWAVENETVYERTLEDLKNQYPKLEDQMGELEAVEESGGDYPSMAAGIRLRSLLLTDLYEQLKYIGSYGDFLEQISANAVELSASRLFSNPDSFAYKNIIRTEQDFSAMRGRELMPGNNRAFLSVMADQWTLILQILFMLAAAIAMTEDRKDGLWQIIHASPKGRWNLAAKRALLMLVLAGAGTAALYGGKLLLAFYLYGIGDIGRLIQSIPEFQYFPVPMTILQFIGWSVLLQILCAYLSGMLFLTVLSAVRTVQIAAALIGIGLSAEYILYTQISANNILVWLKTLNVFSLLDWRAGCLKYLNFNCLGHVCSLRKTVYVLLTVCTLITLAACWWVYEKHKIRRNKERFHSLRQALRRIPHLPFCGSLYGIEWYKALVMNRGIWVFLLFGAALWMFFPLQRQWQDGRSYRISQLYEEWEGPLSEEKYVRMLSSYEDVQENLAGENEGVVMPDFLKQQADADERQAWNTVLLRTGQLLSEAQERGEELCLINPFAYERLYGANQKSYREAKSLLQSIALILILPPLFTADSHMKALITAAARGRGCLRLHKAVIAAIITALVWASANGLELWQVMYGYGGLRQTGAPAASLSLFAGYPKGWTVRAALCLIYAGRLAALEITAAIILCISAASRQTVRAVLVSALLLLLPVALYLLGAQEFGRISPVVWAAEIGL